MSCPDCFKGTIHTYASPSGTTTTLHGLNTYITSQESTTNSSKSTIIFLTDAFGFNLVNSKLLADRYSHETGLRILMPDIIPGGGVPVSTFALMEIVTSPVAWWDLAGHFRRVVGLAKMLWDVIPFATRTRNVFPSILDWVRSVKSDLPMGGKLGLAGFCWGGMHAVRLCKEATVEVGQENLIDACFVAHPAGLKVDEFVEGVGRFSTPFSMAVGDSDFVLKKEAVGEISKKMKENFGDGDEGVKYEIEMDTYKGCGHGFAVRADETKTVEIEGAGKAAEQAARWFKRFL